MKGFKYLILFLWLFPGPLKADVIIVPYSDFGIALSFEIIEAMRFHLQNIIQ